MARKMCPKCGSRDTAKILWGEPCYTVELYSQLDKGAVFFGGCCIPTPEPRYHCNQCSDEFAYRRTKTGVYSGGMLSVGNVKKFHCSIGGFFGRNYVCGIDIERYGLFLDMFQMKEFIMILMTRDLYSQILNLKFLY